MHLVKSMAYVGEKPWHGLGNQLAPRQPIEVWAKQAGMDWQIESSEVRFVAGSHANSGGLGAIHAFPEQRVLYRSDTKVPLSVVSSRYQVVQPAEILDFYKDLTEISGFELETAGVLKDGKKLWALARTGQSATLRGKDQVNAYLLLATACDGTIRRCHELGIHHRDIKPDNIVLRDGQPNQPVIVDFGMAWSKRSDGEVDFSTPVGQEIGNRFLRLPEFAPGAREPSASSDLALCAGVLMYMLSGKQPHVLEDENGRPPHEFLFDHLLPETTNDVRWPRLARVLKIAFQPSIDYRYGSADEMVHALNNLKPLDNQVDPVAQALEKLEQLSSSSKAQRFEANRDAIMRAGKAFFETFNERLNTLGFEQGGQGPTHIKHGYEVLITCAISKVGVNTPRIEYWQRFSFDEGRFTAEVTINQGKSHRYFEGHLADDASLLEAAIQSVDTVLAELLHAYADAVEANMSSTRDERNLY